MNTNIIRLENLQALLREKNVLEQFLRELLSRPITLKGNLQLALPWKCDRFPEIYGIDTDGADYAIHIGSDVWMGNEKADTGENKYPMIKEFIDNESKVADNEKEFRLPDDEKTFLDLFVDLFPRDYYDYPTFTKERHRILISPKLRGRCDPYYTVGPLRVWRYLEIEETVQYHFLFPSGNNLQAAPQGIQMFLACLSGKDIGDTECSTLVKTILQSNPRLTWLDRLRWMKKSVYAKELKNAKARYIHPKSAKKIALLEADKFSDAYMKEHLRFINSFRCISENDFWTSVPNEILAEKLEIPTDMIAGLKAGRIYGIKDFQALYHLSVAL